MIKMRPYAPPDRIAIRDSIDEEISDDVEDDVFIRDGRSAKLSEENGLKRPLMPPRRRNGKLQTSIPIMKKPRRCWKCCEPFCYGLAALTILIALIFLAALILTMFPIPLQRIKVWLKKDPFVLPNAKLNGDGTTAGMEFVPCTQISVQRVWSKVFPRMNSESPLRKVDLNGDGVLDIVFGYGVDDSVHYEDIPMPKCKSLRDDAEVTCEGGVIALNGVTGQTIWQKWTSSNVFSLLCSLDIDKDGYTDCVAAGHGGMVLAINGRNGNSMWDFQELEVQTNSPIVIDLYTINTVRDLDGDDVPDIIAAHVEERETSRAGHIKLISGKTGKVLRTIPTPFREEVFVPLQTVIKEDGTELLLILTGGQNTPGGIYSIRTLSLMQFTSEKEFPSLYQTKSSGFLVPAVLTDITGDDVADIIVSSFNSSVYAFDGRNYSMLWNFTFPASESVSSIVPGHFNHDNVTDFLIKYNTGPGYPVYYYSQTTILNGINGSPLLDSMMTDSGGSSSLLGGVSISQTFGGDFFLHWQMQCRGKYDAKDAYEFIPDSDLLLQSRADTCALRYNTTTVLKLYAIARHVEPPGAVIFSSDDLEVHLNQTQRQSVTHNSKSPLKHPKMLKKLLPPKEFIPTEAEQAPLKEEKKALHTTQRMNNIRRKPILDHTNDENAEYDPLKRFRYMPYEENQVQKEKEIAEYEAEPANIPEEYDDLYGVDQQRPIHLRNKYPGVRDVRSDVSESIEEENSTSSTFLPQKTSPTPIEVEPIVSQKVISQPEPLSLWDLEVEKEENDAFKEAHELDYSRHRRDAVKPTTSDDDYFLSSISSTGVLLKTLDNTPSSIDFAFALNIRESETYPPLFQPQDLNCIEEKLSAYRSYSNDELLVLRKQFLKQCLKSRIDSITPNMPKFESQLIITRISITCNCRTLEPGEVCSKFEDIDRQRWTEYMGNAENGFYGH